MTDALVSHNCPVSSDLVLKLVIVFVALMWKQFHKKILSFSEKNTLQ